MASGLDDLRVLDLSKDFSGGYCGKLFATFGARVVKVESPGGDPMRHDAFAGPGGQSGAAFLALNGGKEGITLDLAAPAGAGMARRLAAHFDVLIEDSGPGVMERRGLGYAALAALNPRLVYVALSPFGGDGPYAEFEATAITLYALGGYMYLTGNPDREPLQGPGRQSGYLAGAHAYIGALAALWAREATSSGQLVEVTELEALAACHQWTITRYNYNGRIQERNGNRYDSVHPVTYYPCSDGFVSIGASTEDQVERLLLLIGRDDLLRDSRFNTLPARLAHADEFDAEIGPWFAGRTKEEITDLCQEFRVPAAPAYAVDELFHHRQLEARGFWQTVDQPGFGPLMLPGPSFVMPACPGTTRPAPAPGEDNQRVFGEFLGLAADDLRRLLQAGVI